MKATNELIKKYDGVARSLAKRYIGKEDYDDVVQSARIGIWKGIESYKEDLEPSMSSYIWVCAKHEVNHYFALKYSQKTSFYANSRHEELGTMQTISIDTETQGENRSLCEVVGEEDPSINRILIEDAVERALEKVFSKTSKLAAISRNMYFDYLLLSRGVGSYGAMQTLQKKYGVTRQRVHKVVNKYNAMMREELAGHI